MVYHDYDEEDHAFEDEHPPLPASSSAATTAASSSTKRNLALTSSNSGMKKKHTNVSSASGGGSEKSHRARWFRRSWCGVPILVWLLLMVIMTTSLVVVRVTTTKSKNNDQGAPPLQVATPVPTPAPTTPQPTRPRVPTVSPTTYPTHATLGAATQWVQRGNDVGGMSAVKGSYGVSVGVSGDGSVFAEGSHSSWNTAQVAAGHVRVFQYNPTTFTWQQQGSDLVGQKHGDEFGFSLDLSRSGRHIAVGAPGADRHEGPDHGYFAVFGWNETVQDWTPQGPAKWGTLTGEKAGYDVTISELGNVLVIGAPYNDHVGTDAGEIRVFEYHDLHDRWLRRGQDMHGEKAGDTFGFTVSVSDDGRHVVAGAPYSDDGAENAGHVRVFRYHYWLNDDPTAHVKDERYHKLGRTLTGRDAGDNFGWSVAIAADGSVVAAGAPSAPLRQSDGSTLPMVGYVDVYQWHEEEDKWHKLGHPIYGEFAFEGFGKSVELSDDGYTLVVGAPNLKNSRGMIRVFQYQPDAQTWLRIGEPIEGDGEYDYFGDEVAASSNGRVIVSGGNNFDGLERGVGHVRVYHGA